MTPGIVFEEGKIVRGTYRIVLGTFKIAKREGKIARGAYRIVLGTSKIAKQEGKIARGTPKIVLGTPKIAHKQVGCGEARTASTTLAVGKRGERKRDVYSGWAVRGEIGPKGSRDKSLLPFGFLIGDGQCLIPNLPRRFPPKRK